MLSPIARLSSNSLQLKNSLDEDSCVRLINSCLSNGLHWMLHGRLIGSYVQPFLIQVSLAKRHQHETQIFDRTDINRNPKFL